MFEAVLDPVLPVRPEVDWLWLPWRLLDPELFDPPELCRELELEPEKRDPPDRELEKREPPPERAPKPPLRRKPPLERPPPERRPRASDGVAVKAKTANAITAKNVFLSKATSSNPNSFGQSRLMRALQRQLSARRSRGSHWALKNRSNNKEFWTHFSDCGGWGRVMGAAPRATGLERAVRFCHYDRVEKQIGRGTTPTSGSQRSMRLRATLALLLLPLAAWAATIRVGLGAVQDADGHTVSVARLQGRTNEVMFTIGGPKDAFVIFLDGPEALRLAQDLEHPRRLAHSVLGGIAVDIRVTSSGEVGVKATRSPDSASARLTTQSARCLAQWLHQAAAQLNSAPR